MKKTDIHLGESILEIMAQRGITKARLARLLDIKPQSVNYLLKRKSIDTDTLYNVSIVLDHDFSKLFSLHQPEPEPEVKEVAQPKGKVQIEIDLSAEDIAYLSLKNRIAKVLS